MDDGGLSISERARTGVRDIPRDHRDRDRLREEWRLKAKEWAQAQSLADEMEEGRKILLSELTLALIDAGERVTKAADLARTSSQFKQYVRKMHDAKREANNLKIEATYADRLYWDNNNDEARQRAEMRMSR